MTEPQPENWEKVYTVNDYFDGPRIGVADLDGSPHIYACHWNAAADDWDEVFSLTPLSAEDLDPILEQWAIWGRWKAAHDANTLTAADRHPALATDRARYDELAPVVAAILRDNRAGAIWAIPEFRGSMAPIHNLEVRWTRV